MQNCQCTWQAWGSWTCRCDHVPGVGNELTQCRNALTETGHTQQHQSTSCSSSLRIRTSQSVQKRLGVELPLCFGSFCQETRANQQTKDLHVAAFRNKRFVVQPVGVQTVLMHSCHRACSRPLDARETLPARILRQQGRAEVNGPDQRPVQGGIPCTLHRSASQLPIPSSGRSSTSS